MENLADTYNLPFVFFSILIAIFSAFAAFYVSGRVKTAKDAARLRWILIGTFALSLGIWTIYFIGHLAFNFPVAVTYQLSMVSLSIIPVLISGAIAFFIISRPEITRRSVFIGAFFISIGIVSMHYIGIKSMQAEISFAYDPIIWILLAVIVFVASILSLYLLSYLSNVPRFYREKFITAILVGPAVAGIHFTITAAAFFSATQQYMDFSPSSIDSNILIYGVGACLFILFGIAFSSLWIKKRIKTHSKESELKFQSVIESVNDAIIVADEQGMIIQWNHGAQLIFGYSTEEMLGSNINLVIPERFKRAHNEGMKRYSQTKIQRVIGKTIEMTGCKKDGSEFPLEMSLGAWETEKGIFYSSIIRDITERKLAEKKMNDLVYLDPLTGLPNRRRFNERLTEVMALARENGSTFALFYMDLDQFKLVNDTLGHSTGDLLLQKAGERLQLQLPNNAMLSRQGGDEFVLLLPGVNYKKAANYAKRMVDALNEPFEFGGEEVFTTLSIGISLYPSDGKDVETLTKHADIAMYRMKEEGKNGLQFFTQDMREAISRKSKLANGLRKGMEQGEFSVQYQPQVSLLTKEIIGVEALVRWNHPEWGIISPNEFIPIAEETGIIIQIGEYVLQEACRQNKAWHDAGLPPIRIAVNMSARQFSQKNLAEIVENALKAARLDPHYLELELTESIIQSSPSAVATMNKLKSMGIHLSIDDFGTGYSSLSYLKLFPIDTLKIDQYFIRNIEVDQKDAALVKTIIRMAHDLELNVIAEGVETKEQVDFLKTHRCNQAQGYYFNRPLPSQKIEEIYRKAKTY
ncbi:EAL domain-containing protein [Planomicrobium chinense]|uniref:bifunctional diguanylate cyclase/phosphodiesterase n=1 Tax=Planococcus chinensis TaxID=272917 RepID=UPI001CC35D68|nr:EAL domain-containing protein [Planococcus chinensis]MBZ5200849.1 EAL domain-containing protein [Planococcus chinensis]